MLQAFSRYENLRIKHPTLDNQQIQGSWSYRAAHNKILSSRSKTIPLNLMMIFYILINSCIIFQLQLKRHHYSRVGKIKQKKKCLAQSQPRGPSGRGKVTHKVIQIGRLQDYQVQSLTNHHLVNQTTALSVTSSHLLNISREGDSTWAACSDA